MVVVVVVVRVWIVVIVDCSDNGIECRRDHETVALHVIISRSHWLPGPAYNPSLEKKKYLPEKSQSEFCDNSRNGRRFRRDRGANGRTSSETGRRSIEA